LLSVKRRELPVKTETTLTMNLAAGERGPAASWTTVETMSPENLFVSCGGRGRGRCCR